MNKNIVDIEAAKQFAGTEEFARELIDMLAESLPEHLKEIQTAYLQNNLDTLAKAAHKLHGAVCYTGTPRLKNATVALEIAAKNNQTTELATLLAQFETEVKAFQDEWK